MRKQQCRIACGGESAACNTTSHDAEDAHVTGVSAVSQYSVEKRVGGRSGTAA